VAKRIERAVKSLAIILLAIAGAWVAFSIVRKAVRPFRFYVAEARENRRIQTQIAELQRENAMLRRKVRYLRTPSGQETAARELGWVRKGEVSLVVEPPTSGGKH